MKKTFRKFWLFVAIYLLESIGAIMAVQHSWWWMLPSIVAISLGLQLVEYYAKNWSKFNIQRVAVMVSEIKWQTEEPKEMGMYLVTLRSGKVAVVEFFHYTVAGMEFTDCVPYGISKVVACCKLDSIEPYKA